GGAPGAAPAARLRGLAVRGEADPGHRGGAWQPGLLAHRGRSRVDVRARQPRRDRVRRGAVRGRRRVPDGERARALPRAVRLAEQLLRARGADAAAQESAAGMAAEVGMEGAGVTGAEGDDRREAGVAGASALPLRPGGEAGGGGGVPSTPPSHPGGGGGTAGATAGGGGADAGIGSLVLVERALREEPYS